MSPVGREEFPSLDATTRGTISIGRRLQDPLSGAREGRSAEHRRRPLPARHERQEPEGFARCRRRIVRQPGRRRPEHRQRSLAPPRLGPQPARGPRARRLPQAARAVRQPRTAHAGAELRPRSVHAVGRLPQDPRGRQRLRPDVDPSGELRRRREAAGGARLRAGDPRRRRGPGRVPREAPRHQHRRDGPQARRRRADAVRHPAGTAPSGPGSARRDAAADLQEGDSPARGSAARHGAARHRAQRGRLRRVRRHRPQGFRASSTSARWRTVTSRVPTTWWR